MIAPAPAHGEAGFTLVELLTVVALLGLLSVCLFGGLHTMSKGWHRISERDTAELEVDAARALLRRLLSQCAPELAGDARHQSVRFSGRSTQVAFLAPLLQRFGAEDIVSYVLAYDGDGQLRLAWHFDRADTGDAAGVTAEILAEVSEGTFSFYGADREGSEPSWRPEWVDQRALPKLIRMRFRWHGRKEDVLVAPELTATQCAPGTGALACSE